MSIQTIRNGIYAVLTACGPWKATEVSTCCFDVLESTNACAIVYLPGDSEISMQALGRAPSASQLRRWGITGVLYVKDTGDPKRTLSNVWKGVDDLYSTFAQDNSLQGNAAAAQLTRITHAAGQFIEAGGALWAQVRWTLVADEF